MPLTFARRVYLCSATLISPVPCRRTRLSTRQSPDRRYSAQSADRSTRHACCRRQFQLAGVTRPTWLSLGSQGHFFSFAVCCFAGGLTRGPRLSTGGSALQPRVESRTPPKNRGEWRGPGRTRLFAARRLVCNQSKNTPEGDPTSAERKPAADIARVGNKTHKRS